MQLKQYQFHLDAPRIMGCATHQVQMMNARRIRGCATHQALTGSQCRELVTSTGCATHRVMRHASSRVSNIGCATHRVMRHASSRVSYCNWMRHASGDAPRIQWRLCTVMRWSCTDRGLVIYIGCATHRVMRHASSQCMVSIKYGIRFLLDAWRIRWCAAHRKPTEQFSEAYLKGTKGRCENKP